MKTRIAKLTVLAVVFVTSVSGCASLSLKPTAETRIPVGADSQSLELKFGVARLLERNGKYEEARRGYLEILTLQSHAPSLHRLGVTAIRQNRLDAGLDHLSKAIAAGHPSAELLGDFGYGLMLKGDLPAAESTLRDAVALNPSQERNVNNLAITVGKQGRLRESLQLFRQVNNEPEALANLAFLQAQAEDLDKAKANYSRALELDPELKIAAIGLMEVHNHMEFYEDTSQRGAQFSEAQLPTHQPANHDVDRSPQIAPPAQHPPTRQRIASSPPPPPARVAVPQQQPTNRVLAAIKRPLQLPGRDPEINKTSRRNTASQTAGKLGLGALQPPSFDSHSSSRIVQASFEEAISQPPPAN